MIADRYYLEQRAGEGGMGVVFRAHDRITGAPVALKILHAEYRSPSDIDRFIREAEILATLRHPNIVAHVDHGEAEGGRYFLAMEWLEGRDLGVHLEGGPLSVEDAAALIRKVAEALGVAHARGVVHRDIKPSNIFMREGSVERPAILDFGIAKRLRASRALTKTGAIIGTPSYMAPEQVRGEREIGPAADVFALGCVLYECLLGKPPFVGTHIAAVLAKVLFQPAPPLRAERPELPEALDALVARMLAKEPAERLVDAAAVAFALDHLQLAASGPRSQSPTATSTASALTTGERRIFSVVLAFSPAFEATQGPTIKRSGLHTLLDGLGAHHAWLPDGSLVAAIMRPDSAIDQAVHAARCALLVREQLPDAVVALATGRGRIEHGSLAGEVIDRAAVLARGRASAGVWIDALSADLLRARFRLADVERQPVLLGERDDGDPTRLLLGKPTPCVGRDRQLVTLESVLADCIENQASQAVLVVAPPGVGKSRLRHEFLRRIRARGAVVEVLLGMGAQPSAGSPYGLLGQALRRLCDVLVNEPLPAQREKFYARVGLHLSPPSETIQVRDFLGELAGIPASVESAPLRAARAEPRLMAEQILRAFIVFLRAECSHNPVLLVLDDLQWGDALTVRLIDAALRETDQQSFFVLAFARPEVKGTFPWLWQDRRYQEIRLPGLSQQASERLAREVLGEGPSREVLSRIVTIAAGNALFLEEMIRAIAEGKGDMVPDTVIAMVQARLMRFDTVTRRALRAASVFGESFCSGGVAALLGPDSSMEDVAAALGVLIDAELIERRSDARDDLGFRHALVRDAAYDLLTEADRALGHRLAKNFLESLGGIEPIVLAEHALLGGEPERATDHFVRAAERSLDRNDMETAFARAERGLACGARGTARGVLLALQCEAYFARGGEAWADADAAGSEALDLLPSGSLWWCRAVGRLSIILPNLGQNDRLRLLADRLVSAFPEPSAVTPYVGAMSYVMGMLTSTGDRTQVELFSRRLAEIGASVDPDDALAQGFIGLGHSIRLFAMDADPYQQLTLSRQSVARFECVQDLQNLVMVRYLLGLAEACAGDPASAMRTMAACRDLAQQLESRFWLGQCLIWGAWLSTLLPGPHHLEDGQKMALEAIAMDINPIDTATAHCFLARILHMQGRAAEAEPHVRGALSAFATVPTMEIYARSTLCLVLLAQGRAEEARLAADDGLTTLDAARGLGFCEVDFLTSAAEAQLTAGDLDTGWRTVMRALERIRVRAEGMPDPEMRRRFEEEFTENVRARSLAARWSQGGSAGKALEARQ